ncbi:helix-turn-helix transcriptional regulator [Reyranella massiliensis]|uniref:helix-turn-helix transcriptional regulator n=1 Tax=Reyranella massiliensis TaxID=445220 RepID=UPI0005C284A4|nr:helix-turn-helix transcriptional regulator [Reyranella massiliensis]
MGVDRETEAIGLLYDATLGHVAWSDVGRCLTSFFDGATFTLTTQGASDSPVDIVDMQGMIPKVVELYGAHYYDLDPWRLAAIERRVFDRAVLGTDLVSNLDWQNSRVYSELILPHTDVFHGVMASGTLPGGGVYAFGIHRGRRATPFERTAAEMLQRLLPHIGRALQVRARLGALHRADIAASAALDHLPFGVVQLSSAGRLVTANRAALAMLGEGDGLLLTAAGVHAAFAGDDVRLQLAILQAARTTAGDVGGGAGDYLRILRPSGRRAYTVVATPLGQDRGFARSALASQQAAVMLIVTDPEAAPRIEPRVLSTLFGLTPAEARLVSLLAAGLPLPAIAKRLGVSFETVRTQLATARAKTDTASQVDLVRLVLTALVPVR